MICPHCGNTDGDHREIEDFNAGGDPERSYYTSWQCFTESCLHTIYSYENGFEWPEEEV